MSGRGRSPVDSRPLLVRARRSRIRAHLERDSGLARRRTETPRRNVLTEMEPTNDREAACSSIDRADHTTDSALSAAVGELALEALISEIRRYLAVVDVFRVEGCEPRWA